MKYLPVDDNGFTVCPPAYGRRAFFVLSGNRWLGRMDWYVVTDRNFWRPVDCTTVWFHPSDMGIRMRRDVERQRPKK